MTKLAQSPPVASLSTATYIVQIILRARQNHLVDKFRTDNMTLTSNLLNLCYEAWVDYVNIYVDKSLSDGQRLGEGKEEVGWSKLSELIENPEWKRECLKRDERFEMYFTSAVRVSPMCPLIFHKPAPQNRTILAIQKAREQLQSGDVSPQAAQNLISESKDVLAPMLDAKVWFHTTCLISANLLSPHW